TNPPSPPDPTPLPSTTLFRSHSSRAGTDTSNYGTATVQHASPRTSRGRVSAVVSGDWTWNHDLEPASLRTPDRQIQERCPSRLRSEEHTSELQSRGQLVCRLL